MKHNAITKSNRTVRGLYKTLAVLVALFGLVYTAQSQTADLAGKYPFPQNYSYPYGATYMNANSTTQLQLLYDNWKKNYYEEKAVGGVNMARIKFVQADEQAGANTVSEGIAYGMLITLWMDNTTNKTKNMFDRLFAYYKMNKDPMTGVLMNWKVVGFTGTVTAPTSGNSNSATDADLDVAASLILAAEQWSADATYYKAEAQKMLNAIWSSEILTSDYHVKPGDAFDDWLNPCYFITNELELFSRFDTGHDWGKVRDKSYAIMTKVANPTTGLLPDWVNNDANYSYITSVSNPKFTSYFLYDAIRNPWRLAMAYSWYGHASAKTLAAKTTDWAINKYGNSPGSIVDGYFLDGTVFDGTSVGLGAAYPTHGKNHNPCFSGGIGVGGMVDGTKYSTWIPAVWSSASQVDAYGMYYTNTTQLMYMMYMTGNMPNLTDMQPVFVSAVTNSTGTKINVTFSKELNAASVTASAAGFVIVDGYGTKHVVSAAKLLTGNKIVELTLTKAVIKAPYTVQYAGTTLLSNDAAPKAVAPFGPFDITDMVTEGIPSPKSCRTNSLGSKVFLVMDKEMDESTFDASEFSITVNGTAVTIGSIAINASNTSQIDITITSTPVASKLDVIKLVYSGTTLASTAYVPADPFTISVNNTYLSTTCTIIDDVSGNAGWKTWGLGTVELVNDPATATVNQTLHFKTGGGDNDVKTTALASKKLRDAFNAGNNIFTYRIYPKTAISKLRFRLFDVTNALNWGDNQILDETTVIPATELNKWTEKTLDLSGFAGGTYPIDGVSIHIPSAVVGEFYIDDIRLCAAVPIPHIVNAYTSWDGKTIIAKYNIPVAAPATVTGLTGKATTALTSSDLTISSITEKSGDGTELIFNLATPITDKTAVITLVYDKATGSIKDADGVATESFNITVTNTVSKYVTSGWYDDFNDATDYITANVGGDYTLTENPTATTGAVAGTLTADGSKLTTAWKSVVVAVTDQVWDLTKNPYVTIRYNYTGTNDTAKIQLKDVNGITADEMTKFALKTGWNEVTVDFSGHFIERYQEKGVRAVNPAAIVNAQIMLMHNAKTGAPFTGSLVFDKIVIGKPIRIYDVATKVNQNASVAGTANFDGALYLVPKTTAYTIDEFKAAVFAKTGSTITCSADKAAAIPTTGLPAGDYMVVGYYPSTGGLTSAAYVRINDVTAPKITSTVLSSYPYGATLSVTTDEKATIYLVPFGTAADLNTIKYIGDQRADTLVIANLTGNMNLLNIDNDSIKSKLGQKFILYAADASGNVSTASSSFTINDVTAPTFTIAKTTYATSGALAIQAVSDVSATTMYLIKSTDAISTVADLTSKKVASMDHLASSTPYAISIVNATFKTVPLGYYYIYVADAWGNISAPSPMIQVVSSTIATTGISIVPATLTVDVATTIAVTDPAASIPQKVTYAPATANDQLSVSWASANTDYVVVIPGDVYGTAVILGKKATTTPITVTVTVLTGTAAAPKTWTATMAVTVNAGSVVKLPTAIAVTKAGVAVSKSTVTLAKAATATFAATITPADAKDLTYSFVSRNATVASVTAAGVVTANAVGDAWIVVSSTAVPSIKDSVLISVSATAVTSVAITTPATATSTVKVGASLSLTATILPADATYQDVTWTITGTAASLGTPTVSTNTSSIKVNGLSAGDVTVTVTSVKYPTLKGSITITVEDNVVAVTSLTTTSTGISLKVNEVATTAPAITVNPANATVQTLTWTVEPATLATVSGTGIVTAGSAAGSGYLVATSTSNSAAFVKIPLTISAYEPASVVLAPTTGLTVKVGETKSVFTSVSVLPAAASQSVTYSITPASVATIDATTGKVTGVSVGTATITVSSSKTGIVGTASIDVLPVLVSSITLNKSTLALIKGNKYQLSATDVLPANATNKAITWTSSNASVTVDPATGIITAAGVGSAVISATAVDASKTVATCSVTVSAVAATGVNLSATSLTLLSTDAATTVTAVVVPDSASVQTVTYTVAPAGIVTISATGNSVSITPSAVGTAVITATVTGTTVQAVCSVNVVAVKKDVISVTVDPLTKDVFLGDADFQLGVTVLPSDADQTVAWTSSDSKVVTVTNGLVSIVGVGTATVTAAGGNSKSGACVITVSKRLVSSITVDPTSVSFNTLKAEKTLVVSVSPTNATDPSVTYTSSAPTIATVDANGKITAEAYGNATITIASKDGGATKTVAVSVTAATVSAITASSTAPISVDAGSEATLPTITVTMSDASAGTASWSSANESIAKIVNGKLVAVAPGTTTIIATADGDATKTVVISVTVNKVNVSSLTGVSDAETLTVGGSKDITVSILPANATVQTVTAVSANAAVTATVSGKIVTITGVSATTTPVNVTITVDGVEKVCAVTVSATVVAVESVSFDVTSVSIQRDVTTSKLAYTINPTNATSPVVSFASSDEAVVKVSTDGTLIPVKAGTANVTITVNGKTATIPVTITPIAVTAISVTSPSVTIAPAGTTNVSTLLKVEPANADNVVASYAVTSGNSFATVDPSTGVVTGVADGTATVTITVGTKTTTVSVVVTTAAIPVTSVVAVGSTTVSVKEKASATLSATVEPSGATDKTITWMVDQAFDFVTITPGTDGTCLVTGVTGGTADVYAMSSNGKKVKFTVTVQSVVSSISLSGTTSINIGGTGSIKATVGPTSALQDVDFVITGTAITVTPNGLNAALQATGTEGQSITVVAKAKDGSGVESSPMTITIVKEVIAVESLTLTATSSTIATGENATISVAYTPAATTQTAVTYSSSNDNVATVSADGTITAVHGGTATITVTSTANSLVKSTIVITVTEKVQSFTVALGATELGVGATVPLTVTASPLSATDKTFTAVSSDPAVATVSITGGVAKVTGVKTGKATITLTANDGSGATGTLDVNVTTIAVTGLVIANGTVSTINVNATTTVEASVLPSNATNKGLKFVSSDPTIATVDATTGVVKGLKDGVVIITVSSVDNPNISKTVEITVEIVLPNVVALNTKLKEAKNLANSTTAKDSLVKILSAQIMLSQNYVNIGEGLYTDTTTIPTQAQVDAQLKMLEWAMQQCIDNKSITPPVTDVAANDAVEVTVGPNPTADYIVIKGSELVSVSFVARNATAVSKSALVDGDAAQVSMSDLANGTYFVTIVTKSGNKTVQVIKQ